jgi:hypothetical protein
LGLVERAAAPAAPAELAAAEAPDMLAGWRCLWICSDCSPGRVRRVRYLQGQCR